MHKYSKKSNEQRDVKNLLNYKYLDTHYLSDT